MLAIKTIRVTEGEFHRERPGLPVMRLRPLTFELQHQEQAVAAETTPDDKDWYALVAVLELDPLVAVELDGRFKLDGSQFDFEQAQLRMSLSPDQYQVLTPELQQLLAGYEIQGDLEVGQTQTSQ